MTDKEREMAIVGLVLSSAVIGALISNIKTLYVTERNFRNEYYKKIIEKRFQAHEYLNGLISSLKIAVPDKDVRSYHAIFSGNGREFKNIMSELANKGSDFWVTNKTHAAILALNKEFFRCHLLLEEMNGDAIEVGKKEYFEIGKLRDSLEDSVLGELLTLHKVRRFLREKSVVKDYTSFDLKKRPSES
jgi:hypothetical protein